MEGLKLNSEPLYIPIPAGLDASVLKSPPSAPNAPDIDADLEVPPSECLEYLKASRSVCASTDITVIKTKLNILTIDFCIIQERIKARMINSIPFMRADVNLMELINCFI